MLKILFSDCDTVFDTDRTFGGNINVFVIFGLLYEFILHKTLSVESRFLIKEF